MKFLKMEEIEMEWAIGEYNYIDPNLFNDNARAEIIKLGF